MPAQQPNSNPASTPATMRRYRHVVIGAAIYLLLVQCAVLLTGVATASRGYADFRALYTGGLMVRSGEAHRLYDYALQESIQNLSTPQIGFLAFLYPASTALPFVPLSLLSFRAAYGAFFVVNLLLLWLAAGLLRPSLPHLATLWPPLELVLFIAFFPAAVALVQGQTSILVLVLICATLAALREEKPLRAGILLGLAIFKFQIALPLAVLLMLRRRLSFAAGFLAGAAATLAASLCVTGYPAFLRYWHSLWLTAAALPGRAAPIDMPPAMMPNLYGLAKTLSGGAPWGALAGYTAALLLFLGIALRRAAPPAAIVGALLVSPHLGIHDLVLLLPAIALALDHALTNLRERWSRSAALLALILTLPPLYLYWMGQHRVCWLSPVILAFLASLMAARVELPGNDSEWGAELSLEARS